MKRRHKYYLGELVLYKSDLQETVGIISGYDERYYLIDWYGEVPKNYRTILAEVEIKVLRENLLKIFN